MIVNIHKKGKSKLQTNKKVWIQFFKIKKKKKIKFKKLNEKSVRCLPNINFF